MNTNLTGLGGKHITFASDDITKVCLLYNFIKQSFIFIGTNIISLNIKLNVNEAENA